jgi:hypothetical protein
MDLAERVACQKPLSLLFNWSQLLHVVDGDGYPLSLGD